MISPGYLRYADEFTEGAMQSLSHQQTLIREYHEKLKEEFFNKGAKPFRIWPVILGQMKANRVHVPKFLSNSLFYCFPHQNGSDNLLELLRVEFKNSQA